MKILFQGINYRTGVSFAIALDPDELALEFHAEPEHAFSETYETIEAMNAAYQERVAPYLRKDDCYDIDRQCILKPEKSLAALFAELRARQSFAAADPALPPLDRYIVEFSNLLRGLINEAVGSRKRALENVVFYLGDSGIQTVIINPDGIRDTDDAAMEAVLKKNPYGGWFGRGATKVGYSLEMNPLGDELDPYGDPSNLYDGVVDKLFDLACAHIEENPQLRANVTPKNLRVFWVFHDGESDISFARRQRAREALAAPAEAFFTTGRS